MPGTTYPSNPYPSQAPQSHYTSQRIPDIRPNMSPQPRPVHNPHPNIPRRRLTPYDTDSNSNSASPYHQRNFQPSFDTNSQYPQSHPSNFNPSPIPLPSHPYPPMVPHPYPLASYNTHHFPGRGGRMFTYYAVPPQNLASWNSNVPAIQPLFGMNNMNMNINFPPPPRPAPSPRPEVWILDCKNCGMFLSNRGMKAVLLLHQTVSLFSTDALPVNCSAYSSNPNVYRPAPAAVSASSSSSLNLPPNRTCECLTQTLCCHGCGGMVGYMIVSPCSRCITFTTQNNRQTNGHRFVFHSSEVVGSVRHYVPGEPGVVSFEESIDADGITAPLSPPPLSSPLPLSLLNSGSPTWVSASLPGLTGPGSVSASSSGSGSSGSGLVSGLFFSPGEGDAELRRDASRSSGSGGVRELGRGRDVSRGARFMGPRSQPHLPTHPRADSRPRPAPPSSGVWSTSLPDLGDVSASGPFTEEAVQYLDDYEEPPSLVTSSGYNTSGYQFPYYLEGTDHDGSTFHQSRASTPQSQPQSPPPPPGSLTPLPPLPMTIPVPSSVYPHPAQNASNARDEPLSHTIHSVPLPAVPSHSPTSSSPSAASPSLASSAHLQASQRDRKKTLKKGDILYWHNLQKSGEIPGVEEDQRARVGSGGGGLSKGTERATGRKYFGMVIGGR